MPRRTVLLGSLLIGAGCTALFVTIALVVNAVFLAHASIGHAVTYGVLAGLSAIVHSIVRRRLAHAESSCAECGHAVGQHARTGRTEQRWCLGCLRERDAELRDPSSVCGLDYGRLK